MPNNDISESAAKLRKLADRLHRGWAKLHPVTEKQMLGVREAVRDQWLREQQVQSQAGSTGQTHKPKAPKQAQTEAKRRKRRNDQSHGHSH